MTPPVVVGATVGLLRDIHEAVTRYRISGVKKISGPSVLTWWLVLYGAFVFVRTPHGHQYYAVILTPPIALLAADGLRRVANRLQRFRGYTQEYSHAILVVLILTSTLAGTAVIFELSGEFSLTNGGGTQVASDGAKLVTEDIPEDTILLVSNGYVPPVKWYIREDLPVGQVAAYRVGSLNEKRIQTTVEHSSGPVYLLYPSPTWDDPSSVPMERMYISSVYEYTLMSYAGRHVETDSKFTFYLNDRRLVVYQIKSEAREPNS
jgi:hypothetical protein